MDGPTIEPMEATKTVLDADALRDSVVEALHTVYDPEIPVDIYELGLVYRVDVGVDGLVDIDMTLTAPNCPVAEQMPEMVREAVIQVDGVQECTVQLVFDPPWTPDLMSETARMALDIF